jgi:site-specific DNA recombinase
LRNEKYMGTVVQGKTFKPDVLSKKRHINIGQRELHTMEDCMPAIVSKKKFELVQAMLTERNSLRSPTQTGEGKFSSKYAFSGMLYCGTCGGKMRRHAQYRQSATNRTWACITHIIYGDEECTARCVREDDIKAAFVRALQRMMNGEFADALERLKQNISDEVVAGDREQITRLSEQIDGLREQILAKNKAKRQGGLSDLLYEQSVADLEMEIDTLDAEKQKLMDAVGCLDTANNRIKNMFAAIESTAQAAEFNDGMFKELVESIIITEYRKAEIHFNCGIVVAEELEPTDC